MHVPRRCLDVQSQLIVPLPQPRNRYPVGYLYTITRIRRPLHAAVLQEDSCKDPCHSVLFDPETFFLFWGTLCLTNLTDSYLSFSCAVKARFSLHPIVSVPKYMLGPSTRNPSRDS